MARVVVAMSGGVDSSVAAALLKEEGHEVIGIMMRLWSEPNTRADGDVYGHNKCCSIESVDDARRVSQLLDIPFYLINVEQEFQANVVQYFTDGYSEGRTPNPCLSCNRTIRFGLLLKRALALDADYLATGHYARTSHDPVGYHLLKGVDAAKDQSYVLHMLNQEQLAHVIFPVGPYTKSQVRELAAQRHIPVAQKAESQELCFVADNDYRRFLRQYVPAVASPGPIYNLVGQELGEHEGLAFYTIGQRHGLKLQSPEPLYVLKLDRERNALIVGPQTALGKSEFIVRDVTFTSEVFPGEPDHVKVKIRYKAPEQEATITPLRGGKVLVTLTHPQRAITPGQGAVFYRGEEALGGGIIERVLEGVLV